MPPVRLVEIPAPVESAESPLESCRFDDVSVVEPAKVRLSDASTSLGIAVEFNPQTKQVMVPTPLLHERVLPEAPGPAEKLAEAKSVVE